MRFDCRSTGVGGALLVLVLATSVGCDQGPSSPQTAEGVANLLEDPLMTYEEAMEMVETWTTEEFKAAIEAIEDAASEPQRDGETPAEAGLRRNAQKKKKYRLEFALRTMGVKEQISEDASTQESGSKP